MPRIRRSEDLGSRESRRRLKVRAEPYWHRIEPGSGAIHGSPCGSF